MSDKSVTLSARLPVEDVEFLNNWVVEGAESSSEKLRKVVKEARKRSRATHDYKSGLRVFQQLFSSSMEFVKETELETGQHSELLARLNEWLPELSAYVHSAEGLTAKDSEQLLRRFEGGIAMRLITLMQSILQMSITKEGPFYDTSILSTRIQPVLDLADVIRRNQKDHQD